MASDINFIVLDKSGVLGKVSIALINNGFKIKSQNITKTDNVEQKRIQIILKEGEITAEVLTLLKQQVPEIVSIESSLPEPSVSVSSVSLEPASSSENIDYSDLTRTYFNLLVNEFPNVVSVIKKINHDQNEAATNDILNKIGLALGKKQYKTRFALGGVMDVDKTISRLLIPGLKDFLQIQQFEPKSKGFAVLKIEDCPNCIDQKTDKADCVFIMGFISGFLGAVPNIFLESVDQMQSKAVGGQFCEFEIKATNK